MKRRFIQCDVFSPEPCKGNALAVVIDAEGLSDTQMQEFAAWTNLAETTFLLPPTHSDADYEVRIFTPKREMLFAGHPTLGSCASWLQVGGKPKQAETVVQQCAIGLVDIHLGGNVLAFTSPPTKIAELPEVDLLRVQKKLDIDDKAILATALLDNGPVWQVFMLSSASEVLALDSSKVSWPEEHPIGIIGAHKSGHECDFEVRMFAPSSGISEDPITGSLNSAIAHWLQSRNELGDELTIAQGTAINRLGRVFVTPDDNGQDVTIGGHTHIIIEGSVHL